MRHIIQAICVAAMALLSGAAMAQALDAGVYRIGFLTDEAGPLAIEAASFRHGAELAVAEIDAGNVLPPGARLALAPQPGGDDAALAVRGYNRLRADPSVLAIACCIRSAAARATARLATGDGVPLVLYGAGGGGLARPPYVYSVAGWPGADEPGLVRRVARALKSRSAAYFMPYDDAGLRRRADAVRAGLEAAGVTTSGVSQALSADTDLTVAATQLAAWQPDLIVIYATAEPSGLLVAALRARGWSGAIVATDALAPAVQFDRIGAALAGVPFIVDLPPARHRAGPAGPPSPTETFASAYQAMFAAPPDPYAARGYTAVQLVAQALRTLPGRPNRAALATAMAAITRIDGDVYGGQAMQGGQLLVRSRQLAVWTTEGAIVRWSGGLGGF